MTNQMLGSLAALLLWIVVVIGPKDPPSPSAQLAFPFMYEDRRS